MFKSLFGKMTLFFITIFMISYITLGITLYYFLGDFIYSQKQQLIKENLDVIISILKSAPEEGNTVDVRGISNLLEAASVASGSLMIITDGNGYINPILIKGVIDKEIYIGFLAQIRDSSGNYRLPNQSQYNFLNTKEELNEIGDFYGLFSFSGFSWLSNVKTVKINDAVIGIYAFTPVPEVDKGRTSVLRLFLLSSIISIGLAMLLTYILSSRMTKPLKLMKNAAKEISGGNFEKRIEINSRDEIGELSKSFNKMVDSLQNMENMRRDFIANVSHELRTPMTSINGFVEGIIDGTIPEDKQPYYLNIVKTEIMRLSRLVTDLLDLAKMEAGESAYNMQPFDICESLRKGIIVLENQIIQKNIHINANFENARMLVMGDCDAIERVIINILHNAIKVSPYDAEIDVATGIIKGKIYVSITDHGRGISSNDLNCIWDRFYKVDKSRAIDKSGVGLGLAIVKNIIDGHHQEIIVKSEEGKGTEFTFMLEPAKDDNRF